ncbi:MAG: hypothetical protein IT353_24830 [Gemmatimonadaceae bacterium]|nr:hypothetical protein [Gemmatimonadaceae bacterium]
MLHRASARIGATVISRYMELLPSTSASRHLDDFLNVVAWWSAPRWRVALAAAEQPAFRHRHEQAIAIRDAIIECERPEFLVWRATDGCRTVVEMLPPTLRREERTHIAAIVREASLALAARPALPLSELAVLLSPFLPLHIPSVDTPP